MINMNLGESIKSYRKSNNLTQKELAQKSGITRESIGNYERGSRTPPADILEKIATALKVSMNELMGKSINTYDLESSSNLSTGDNIRRIRKHRKLTLKELGEGVGLSEQAIGQYERGERTISIEILKKIAFALDVNLSELLDECTEKVYKELKDYTTDELLAEIKRRIEGV